MVALRSRTRRVARDHLPDGREGKRFGHPKKERKSLVNDKIASLPQDGRSKFETLARGVQKTECVGAKRNESSVVSSHFQASAIRFYLASTARCRSDGIFDVDHVELKKNGSAKIVIS